MNLRESATQGPPPIPCPYPDSRVPVTDSTGIFVCPGESQEGMCPLYCPRRVSTALPQFLGRAAGAATDLGISDKQFAEDLNTINDNAKQLEGEASDSQPS